MPLYINAQIIGGGGQDLEPLQPGEGIYWVTGRSGSGRMLFALCNEHDFGARVFIEDVREDSFAETEDGKKYLKIPEEANLVKNILPLFGCTVEMVDEDGDEWLFTFQHRDKNGAQYCPN